MAIHLFAKSVAHAVRLLFVLICAFILALPGGMAYGAPGAAPQAEIKVTTPNDEFGANTGECSLREAIQAANTNSAFGGCNAGSGGSPDAILLGDINVILTIAGAGEDANATGDLDINGDLIIVGDGYNNATVDGGSLDRVFEIHSGDVTFTGFKITNGALPQAANGANGGGTGANGGNGATGAGGGGIFNDANLTLESVWVDGNKAGWGGDGGNGSAGLNAPAPGIAGQNGGNGGGGGQGGFGGGIYNNGVMTVTNSIISNNAAGRGGDGGNGAAGGNGINGAELAGKADGSPGGNGGNGGIGNSGGAGGGIFSAFSATLLIQDSTFSTNTGGRGGSGGMGGPGGDGKNGVNQWPNPTYVNAAGSGGDAGDGGAGGAGGYGGSGSGVYTTSNNFRIENSLIEQNSSLPAGPGGVGGSGGDGGNGGNGLAGDQIGVCNGGHAGDGGAGGNGATGGGGGSGGGFANVGYAYLLQTTIKANQSGNGSLGGGTSLGGLAGLPGTHALGPCSDGVPGSNGGNGSAGNGGKGGNGGGVYSGVTLFSGPIEQTPEAVKSLTIDASTISGNNAGAGGNGFNGGDAGFGGGLYNFLATTAIDNSTISGNQATGQGGSLAAHPVSGSAAPTAAGDNGRGGGIYIYSGTVEANNTTIAFNQAVTIGGGVVIGGSGTFEFSHTILAKNLANGASYVDCHGSLVSFDYNLLGVPGVCAISGTTTHNKLSIDPLLKPLADYGGPTFTHALLPYSPALDGGDTVCYDNNGGPLNADQRGFARPVDHHSDDVARCDIGAYESQYTDAVFLPVVVN